MPWPSRGPHKPGDAASLAVRLCSVGNVLRVTARRNAWYKQLSTPEGWLHQSTTSRSKAWCA